MPLEPEPIRARPAESVCPLCGDFNNCGVLDSAGGSFECWCRGFTRPTGQLIELAKAIGANTCICRNCASRQDLGEA